MIVTAVSILGPERSRSFVCYRMCVSIRIHVSRDIECGRFENATQALVVIMSVNMKTERKLVRKPCHEIIEIEKHYIRIIISIVANSRGVPGPIGVFSRYSLQPSIGFRMWPAWN